MCQVLSIFVRVHFSVPLKWPHSCYGRDRSFNVIINQSYAEETVRVSKRGLFHFWRPAWKVPGIGPIPGSATRNRQYPQLGPREEARREKGNKEEIEITNSLWTERQHVRNSSKTICSILWIPSVFVIQLQENQALSGNGRYLHAFPGAVELKGKTSSCPNVKVAR